MLKVSKVEASMTKGRILFTGSFGEFFLMSLGLLVLSVITFGLLIPYFIYWQYKYFVSHLEVELYHVQPETHRQAPSHRPQPSRI
jgi:uncharacterized membrane protein YjgN (DUF898 family)